jgi:hypothetical protein
MRWVACSVAAMAVWAAAASVASARTGLEEPLGLGAESAATLQVNARRPNPDGIVETERGAAPRDEHIDRADQDAARALACTGREACGRRRGGAGGDAIPDRALMRQRAIL